MTINSWENTPAAKLEHEITAGGVLERTYTDANAQAAVARLRAFIREIDAKTSSELEGYDLRAAQENFTYLKNQTRQ